MGCINLLEELVTSGRDLYQFTISSIVIRLKSYLWHLERMVTGILCTSVVAKIKIT